MKRDEKGSITLETTIAIMMLFVCVICSYWSIFKVTKKSNIEFHREFVELVEPVEFCDSLNLAYQYSSALLDGIDMWLDGLGEK